MTASEDKSRSAIIDQAAAWFAAHRAGPLDEASRAAFFAWLKASPVHVEEYLRMAALDATLTAAVDDPDVSVEALVEAARHDRSDQVLDLQSGLPFEAPAATGARRRPRVSRRGWAALAVAAGLAVVALKVLWAPPGGEPPLAPLSYQTAHGAQGTWRLPDGSELRLNTDSVVTVRFTARERLVELAHGQAFFRVAHEPGRPFRVAAGASTTIAVGTEFDVYRRRDTARVTVVQGRVLVLSGNSLPAGAEGYAGVPSLSVGAGQQVNVVAGALPAAASAADLRQAVAWLDRQIAFEQRPLGEVAEEFNRYNAVVFEIDDPQLRQLTISGVFDAFDTASFAAFLENLDGVRVERQAQRVRVVSAKARQATT